jgi:conjugative transfer signal peptidase TraF
VAASAEGYVVNARCATIFVTFAVAVLLLSTVGGTTPHYIWNASNSVPVGLYRVLPVTKLTVTELVAVQPPDPLATFLDLNGYLPVGVPMLKRVLALPGQTVCRDGLTIAVDNIAVGQAHERDKRGRPLPVWQGCRVIADGDVFVMNWQSTDSLDSRYFGPLPASTVVGRAVPVWTDEQ